MTEATRIPQSETTPQSGAQILTKLDAALSIDTAAALLKTAQLDAQPIKLTKSSLNIFDIGFAQTPALDGGERSFYVDLSDIDAGQADGQIRNGNNSLYEAGAEYLFVVKQHATVAGRTVDWDTSTIFNFPADTPPVQTAAVGQMDIYRFKCITDDLFGGGASNKRLYFIGVEQDITPQT